MYRILLVGGGTAGHVEPALAVGDWLLNSREESIDIACEFIGTRGGIENDLVPAAGLKLHHIVKSPLPRRITPGAFLWPLKFVTAFLQALSIIRSADLVLGFGGYVSAPCYLAARFAKVPIFVHEANALPGWANKLGAKFAAEILIAFSSTSSMGPGFKSAKLVGMPIREEIFVISKLSKSERAKNWGDTYRELGIDRSKRTIFVFGGSLGANSINRAVADALPELLNSGYNIIHSVGKGNVLPEALPGYLPLAYVGNMAEMYIASDLIISRGGAVSCAEIDASNSFALIVPLAIGNGEQIANAQELIAKGSAQICLNVDFTGKWILANIEGLMAKAIAWKAEPRATQREPAAAMIGKLVLENLAGRSK
jgi:UDP-N-acetylglucosamine--N-acetylmuramyl-(pentapeptide) pyrophosphoryl-undecaprenol N-acetylglucosamine transferase